MVAGKVLKVIVGKVKNQTPFSGEKLESSQELSESKAGQNQDVGIKYQDARAQSQETRAEI
ncbi:hypothetical protein GCM10009119_03560 [Algoriphagus jejuensis]|uniref:Uncharacterized protein n=1 Tax=Algoriphagus jejuensis TaxID=419934 RepID=A0ABN1MVG7_9BACT